MAANAWRSSHLTYRALEPEDAPFIHHLHSDSEGRLNNCPDLAAPNPKSTVVEITGRPNELMSVMMCLLSSNNEIGGEPVPIGRMRLYHEGERMIHHRAASVGIHILPQYQGQGYGTEAMTWALNWAFRMANMHRVGLFAVAWNTRAIALYERMGFVHEGRSRESLWFDGAYRDAVHMSILDREWRSRNGADEES